MFFFWGARACLSAGLFELFGVEIVLDVFLAFFGWLVAVAFLSYLIFGRDLVGRCWFSRSFLHSYG